MPLSPHRLTQEARRLRDEAKGLRAAAEAQASELERKARILDAAFEELQEAARLGTVGTAMEPGAARTRGANVSAAKIKDPCLFQRKLAERGLSLPEWVATKNGSAKLTVLDVETAKSWLKRGTGGRKIPRLWADIIAGEFKDPRLALSASWPSGIRD